MAGNLRVIPNPFTGNLQFLSSGQIEGEGVFVNLTADMVIDENATLGSLVFLDTTKSNTTITAIDNNPDKRVIGFVREIITESIANILFLGVIDGLGLSAGDLFVGDDGRFSLTSPSPGYIQRVGFSIGGGRAYFQADYNRTLIT